MKKQPIEQLLKAHLNREIPRSAALLRRGDKTRDTTSSNVRNHAENCLVWGVLDRQPPRNELRGRAGPTPRGQEWREHLQHVGLPFDAPDEGSIEK